VPRILLADDDVAFREQLAEVVNARVPDANIVASVGDGHEAVAAAMRHSPALVLIDYEMPGPNGGHAAAVIMQALPDARVVILSGLPRDQLFDVPDDVPVVAKGAAMEDDLMIALRAQR
jgi:two-component system, NarL family, response regulator DesR